MDRKMWSWLLSMALLFSLISYPASAAASQLSRQGTEEGGGEGIALSEEEIELYAGDSWSLSAYISGSDAAEGDVVWSCSDTSVAEVDEYGLVTAVSPGSAWIWAASVYDSSDTASCLVTVLETVIHVPVSSVSLNEHEISLKAGDTCSLTYIIYPEDAENRTVSWKSSNSAAAGVDSIGKVTAVAEGEAVITITSADGGYTDECVVTVEGADSGEDDDEDGSGEDDEKGDEDEDGSDISENGISENGISENGISVNGISVNGISVNGIALGAHWISISLGDSCQLSYTVYPADAENQNVSWSSSESPTVSVNGCGLITGAAVGKALITVTTEDGGFTDSCSVEVTSGKNEDEEDDDSGDDGDDEGDEEESSAVSVNGVSLDADSLEMTEGDTYSLKVSISPENAAVQDVSFESSDEETASVTPEGVVTALSAGKAVITVTTVDGGYKDSCAVTVNKKIVRVEGVELDRQTLKIKVGESASLMASIIPSNADNTALSWNSTNEDVAVVDSDGTVSGSSAGSAGIVVTTQDGGYSAVCSVTVEAEPVEASGVRLSYTSLKMEVGDQFTLRATVIPANASNKTVSWYSTDESTASVDSRGMVRALKAGSARIAAVTEDGGYTALCSVTVNKPSVEVTGVELSEHSLEMTVGDTAVLSATVTPSDADNTEVGWNSSDTDVATVDERGVVRAIEEGSSKIIVTTADGNFTDICSVTVVAKPVDVTGVILDRESLTMTVGGEESLTAAVLPANADNKAVTWSSSDSLTARVSGDGTVTGVGAGRAYITVTTVDGNYTAMCLCVVEAEKTAVSSVSLNKTVLSLEEGEEETLSATVYPEDAADKSVNYASSDTSVAVVDRYGTVTASGAGTAIITVYTEDGGFTDQCTVVVVRKGDEDSVDAQLAVKEKISITSIFSDTGLSVKYVSGNRRIASITKDGMIKAKRAGMVTIYAFSGGVQIDEARIYIVRPEFNVKKLYLKAGDTCGASNMIVNNYDLEPDYYESRRPGIVSIDEDTGKITALVQGVSKVWAYFGNKSCKSRIGMRVVVR